MYTSGVMQWDVRQPVWVGSTSHWQGVPLSRLNNPAALALTNPEGSGRVSKQVGQNPSEPARGLVTAGLAYGAGVLLRSLPTYTRPGKHWVPSDWKMFARPILGVYAVAQLNKALGWQPPPWLQGIETMSAITPLMSGVSRYGVGQWLTHAPLIGGLVQAAHLLNQSVSPKLKDEFGVPVLVTRLITSALITALGYWAIPPITKHLLKMPLPKRWFPPPKEGSVGATLAGAMTTCARGCTPGGLICMSELSELIGSMGLWAHGQNNNNPSPSRNAPAQVRFGSHTLPEEPTAEEQALMAAMDKQMEEHYRLAEESSAPSTCCGTTENKGPTQAHSCCEVPSAKRDKTSQWFEAWQTSPNILKRWVGRFVSWVAAFVQGIRNDVKHLLNPFSVQSLSQR